MTISKEANLCIDLTNELYLYQISNKLNLFKIYLKLKLTHIQIQVLIIVNYQINH